MRPLSTIALGILIVVIDVRIAPIDLVADPLGWLLVGWGAARLSMARPARLAWVTALLSLADAFLPFDYAQFNPFTGEMVDSGQDLGYAEHLVFPPLDGWRLAALAASIVLAAVTLGFLIGGLRSRALAWERQAAARPLAVLQWAVLGLWAGPQLWFLASDTLGAQGAFDPVWNDGREMWALGGALALVVLVVVLLRETNHAWAVPEAAEGPWATPWDVLKRRRPAQPAAGH